MNPDYAALSASDGDGEPVRATVQSLGRSIGSTTIPVQATTNWPAGTFIATTGTLLSSGKLDPTTVQVFYGTASGTDITITAFAAGYTDKGNLAGDVVVIKPTTEWANVVAEGILGTTQFPANFANFVEPGSGVWSDGSGLVGSGTSGFVWYNGARSAMAAVTNHTFAATKDTYIDYNPTLATWTYLPETNGSVEPAVSTGSVRIAKVVTGASAISTIIQEGYNTPVDVRNLSKSVKFFAYRAASLSQTSNAVIVMDTEVFDTSDNFNPSTGVFTAPVAGIYEFKANVNISASTSFAFNIQLQKNGSGSYVMGGYIGIGSGAGTNSLVGNFPPIQLAAGDTIAPYFGSSNGGGTTVDVGTGPFPTWFSGQLLSKV